MKSLRTELGRVRGIGAAHHGVGHWWIQRVTAVALIPLSLWFVSSLITALLSPNVVKVAEWLASPTHAILMVMLIVSAFWHAKLGVQVVIEDYVHGAVAKYTLLLLNTFLNVAFATICIMAVLKLHFLDAGATI